MNAALLISVGATWMLYVSGVFVLWTPLPLLYRYSRNGGVAFAASLLIAILGLLLLYMALLQGSGAEPGAWERWFPLPGFGFRGYFGNKVVLGFGLLYFSYYAAIAGLLGWMEEKRYSLERSFGIAIFAPLIGMALVVLVFALANEIDVMAQARNYMLHVLDNIIKVGTPAGLSGEDLRFLQTRREDIAQQVLRMLPAGAVIGTLVTVWGNVLLARLWSLRFDKKRSVPLFHHFGSLTKWRMVERFVWVPIVAGAVYFLDVYLISGSGGDQGVLAIGASNILWVCGAIYFFQGLAIVAYFAQSRRSIVTKVLIYGALIFFFQVLALFVAALGLFDVWFNFRKRNFSKKESSQGE